MRPGPLDAPGAAVAGGHGIAVRNVPSTAWPLNVTWATLSALAWARNAEYGHVDGAVRGRREEQERVPGEQDEEDDQPDPTRIGHRAAAGVRGRPAGLRRRGPRWRWQRHDTLSGLGVFADYRRDVSDRPEM